MDNSVWDALEGLDFELPSNGTPAPEMEVEPQEQKEDTGILWELKTTIYMWSSIEGQKYQLFSTQNLAPVAGDLTLEEAKTKIARRGRGKKNPPT